MKKYILASFAAVLLLGSFQVARADTSGLQAWWKLDEGSGTTANDSSGNSNAGTLIGSPSYTTGKVGSYALGFNGTSQYIQIPNTIDTTYPTSGNTSTYTLSFAAWFKTTSGGVIFSQDDGTLPPNGVGGYVPAVYVSPTTGKVYGSIFWHGSTNFQIVSPGTYLDGNWHQVVDVFSNGTETLYVDGASVGTQSASESGYSRSYRYFVGTGYGGSWPGLSSSWTYFSGSLDDVRVYSTALSASDVSQLYSSGNTQQGGGSGNSSGSSPTSALSGWAWSSNIGWISFNSTDQGTGTGGTGMSSVPYEVDMSTTTGSNTATFSGYAWSPNIGWLSFQPSDVADCPGGTANAAKASVDGSGNPNGSVTGYVRVISEVGQNDGWDGCVSLGDTTLGANQYTPTADSNYFQDSGGNKYLKGGVTYSILQKLFGGFAWSNTVLGWLSFYNPYPIGSGPVIVINPHPNSGPDFTVGGNSVSLNPTDSQGVDTVLTINRAPGNTDTTEQDINESLSNLPSGVTAVITDNPATCIINSSNVSCSVHIHVTSNGATPNTYTSYLNGVRTVPTAKTVQGSLAITIKNPSIAPVNLYIGPNVTTINSVPDASKPTSLSIKKGNPFALEWKINLDSSYTCTPVISKGTWDHWNGSQPVDLGTNGQPQTGNVSMPSTDTSANTASTYTFTVKCISSNNGSLEQDGSANLILQSSSESEI